MVILRPAIEHETTVTTPGCSLGSNSFWRSPARLLTCGMLHTSLVSMGGPAVSQKYRD